MTSWRSPRSSWSSVKACFPRPATSAQPTGSMKSRIQGRRTVARARLPSSPPPAAASISATTSCSGPNSSVSISAKASRGRTAPAASCRYRRPRRPSQAGSRCRRCGGRRSAGGVAGPGGHRRSRLRGASTRSCGLLQPRRGVHRRPGDVQLAATALPRHGLAGLDAGADGHGPAVGPQEPSFIAATRSRSSTAAVTAPRASSSWSFGIPKTAITASR